jgi:hypothetical protein
MLEQVKLCKMGARRSDHVHFTGRGKPWFHGPPGNETEEKRLDSAAHFWFTTPNNSMTSLTWD